MDKVTNILMVGVGGQGVILASEIVAEVMMRAGFDVKKNEVHGMAQRGGSVNSHVRFGSKVYSPVIKKGEVDILLSFEQLETMRYLDFLKEDSVILVNNQKIVPPSVTFGTDQYPVNIPELLAERYPKFVLVDGIWQDAISSMISPKLVEVNLKAFEIGREKEYSLLAES